MKQRISTMAMAGVLALCLIGSASAAGVQGQSSVPPAATKTSARGIETEWQYRVVDGQWQKRLWSVSEGKWLTDWVNM